MEKDIIYSSNIRYAGIFDFREFYDFCYNWFMSEIEPSVFNEKTYSEKLTGNKKVIELEWEIDKKLTDYYKYQIKVKMKVTIDKRVEMNQDGRKIQANEGDIKVGVKGALIKDYEAQFEATAFQKVWRAIYEKWISESQTKQFEGKVLGDSEEFLNQAKAFLDLEGKK